MARNRLSDMTSLKEEQAPLVDNSSADIVDIVHSLDQIKSDTERLKGLHKRQLTEIDTSGSLRNQVEKLTSDINLLIDSTRIKIKQIPNAGKLKVQQEKQKGLANKMIQVAKEYRTVQENAKEDAKKQLSRQYKIVNPNATAEEVKNAVDDNSMDNIFNQQLMNSNVSEQRKMLDSVKSRQSELVNIEKSMVELFQLMEDMNILLNEHEIIIDQIDTNILAADEDLEKANIKLKDAIEYGKSARKKKLIIAFIAFIILLIIAIVIVTQITTASQ
ncbi:Plasma membrane t-SNARE, secretory vesicle fusion [Lobulomyces angularis]|nr:Plasma membrane t-SNARE, secretory vesicle fusion [Lobulomyces angularis]